MNSKIILETSRLSLLGEVSFGAVVQALIEAGAEYYHADYATLRTTYYGGDGSVAVAPIAYEGLPPIGSDFSTAALKAAILDSQLNGQKYRDFSRRAMAAGVQSYTVFLRGRRVIYTGRQGDQHIELFPPAP